MLKPLHATQAPPLRIKSDQVLFAEGVAPAVLEVEGGFIRNIRPHNSGCDIDVSDSVLMPAIVDTHVHVNEPGREEWEGWATATQAAAHGGVAVLADMPLNSMPVTTSVQALEEKIHSTSGKLWVDCALWGGVVPGNTGELSGMVDRGVAGLKAFLCHSGIDEFPAVEREDLLSAMPELKAQGVPLLFHAELESDEPIDVRHHSVREYVRWLHARPREWEDRAVAMVIELVQQTGCPAHIVHLSSATALPMLQRAKQAGLPITVETCPHYLCLTAEEARMVPPSLSVATDSWSRQSRGALEGPEGWGH